MGKHVEKSLISTWEKLGESDPLWAILASPEKKGGKWGLEEFFEEGKKDVRNLMDEIDNLGIKVSVNRALDFGCGVGRLSQAMCEYFNEVCGVDVSKSMVELAEEYNRFPEKCSYYLNTADDLGIFETGSFDLIFSLITLQHMNPRLIRGYLVEFIRLLPAEGLLVFQLPSHMPGSASSVKAKDAGTLQNIYDRLPRPLHVIARRSKSLVLKMLRKPAVEMHGIKRDRVITLLEAAGGKVVDVRENSWTGNEWVSFTYYVSK